MGGENYVEGDLGAVFNQAEPLTLPVVVQLLRGRRDTGDDTDAENPAMALIERTRGQVEMMQETCADEHSVRRVLRMRLRLRDEGETGFANAHLANFVLDAEGNVTGVRGPAGENGDEALRTARLRPFEVVALATLRPKTVEEALVLLPSLSRYDLSDLNLALNTLESI
ncbi:uncharacterized protein TM35_000091440 [Trypanosoma theileri]|uniref:DNA-directed RNA polymerase n=1 Tax=Trypanosoma theileri TaxID=67003 RepID=A0A1X0NZH4_9TRYP|nr:uncharacterized protein TM35_000091440 [Trypanosoma theileri]ORC90094.1 hypothetical protein TM35_000091440 [Trypanosoma theileri]